MVRAIVHKEDNRIFLEVSSDAPEAEGLQDGQEISLRIDASSNHDLTDEEFVQMIDRIIDEDRKALEYLAQ